jgi:hypothetical protein
MEEEEEQWLTEDARSCHARVDCTAAALRCIVYGAPPHTVNDYFHMAESTALDIVYKFYWAIVGKFGSLYLRAQNEQDTTWIFARNAARGLLRMLGSIKCMHWTRKNYPSAWQGMYKGHGELKEGW